MANLHKRLQMSRLPPMPPQIGPSGGVAQAVAGKKRGPFKRDYTPVSWDKYFERKHDVKVDDNNIFRVYESGSDGPVCFFLHGGGFSALSWALLTKLLIGYVHCRCVAMDIRGHGDSVTADEEDLSAEQLSSDIANVITAMYGENPPPILLIGHSMGGALAVHTAYRDLVPTIIGLIVIDVVEGTAMEALSSMQSFLLTRPKSFKSVEYAVEWCVRSGQVRNLESAKVSMVGQVKKLLTNETATAELSAKSESAISCTENNTIIEEDEDDTHEKQEMPPPDCKSNTPDNTTSSGNTEQRPDMGMPNQYTWRLNLSRTEKYWKGWFTGLSSMFLSCSVPKMLLLAGVDRLDRDLTVGQMQGKFQMQVLPQSGHAVHEDVPEKVADILSIYLIRNKFAQPKDDFERVFPSC